MSKKNKDKKEIIEEVLNSEEENTEETTDKSEEGKKEEEKNEPTIEEQLTTEKDKNLRLFAEFENFRKRTAKERIELFSTANKDIMTILLPILDNFERAINANNYKKNHGVVLIYKKLKTELENKGLKEIENPIGKKLDTEFHEAISNVPSSKKKEKGKIIDVVEKGYSLGNKVIRYTKVVVAN